MAIGDQVGANIVSDPGPGTAGNGALGSNMNGLGMLFQQLQGQRTASQQSMAPAAAAAPASLIDSLHSRYDAFANAEKTDPYLQSKLSNWQNDHGVLAPPDFTNYKSSPWAPAFQGQGAGSLDNLEAQHIMDLYPSFMFDTPAAPAAAPAAAAPTPTPLSGPVGTNFVHLNPIPYLNSMSTTPTPGSSVPNNTLTQISGSGSGAFGSLNPKPGQVDWSQWMNGAGPTGANNY